MNLKKSAVIGLCICSVFSSSIPGVIAADSEKMDSSTTTSNNEYGTFKKFTPSILKEETLKVSTIPKGEAYIPKDTVINVELVSAISWECKIVCVNRYCMNLLYAPYWGKQR